MKPCTKKRCSFVLALGMLFYFVLYIATYFLEIKAISIYFIFL